MTGLVYMMMIYKHKHLRYTESRARYSSPVFLSHNNNILAFNCAGKTS